MSVNTLAFLTPEEVTAIRLSLVVAVACVVATAIPGIGLAWLLARRRFPGHAMVDSIAHLPLVLPPVVVGYMLLLFLGRRSWFGGILHDWFGIEIAFTLGAAVIASSVMAFPLLVRAARLGFELVDPRLEEAAATLGAPKLRVFLTVTLPLAAPGIVTGLVLTFARSLGEFGATIMLAGNLEGRTRTLPVAIFSYTQMPGGEAPAFRLVVISVVVSLAALVSSEVFARRVRRRRGIPG